MSEKIPRHKAESGVLVLNVDGLPIAVASRRQARRLLSRGRAIIESPDSPTPLTQTDLTVDLQRGDDAIRLLAYNEKARGQDASRWAILARDDCTCQYCGTKNGPMTIDHVVPSSRGGSYSWTNLVCACSKCNGVKAALTPREASMPLRTPPRQPDDALKLLFRMMRMPAWQRFINELPEGYGHSDDA